FVAQHDVALSDRDLAGQVDHGHLTDRPNRRLHRSIPPLSTAAAGGRIERVAFGPARLFSRETSMPRPSRFLNSTLSTKARMTRTPRPELLMRLSPAVGSGLTPASNPA